MGWFARTSGWRVVERAGGERGAWASFKLKLLHSPRAREASGVADIGEIEDGGAVPERQRKTSVCTARALVAPWARMRPWHSFAFSQQQGEADGTCSTLKPARTIRSGNTEAGGMAVLSHVRCNARGGDDSADGYVVCAGEEGGYVHTGCTEYCVWRAASVAVSGGPRIAGRLSSSRQLGAAVSQ